eukprot:3867170-Pleurochrysis_carterae.AAC.3
MKTGAKRREMRAQPPHVFKMARESASDHEQPDTTAVTLRELRKVPTWMRCMQGYTASTSMDRSTMQQAAQATTQLPKARHLTPTVHPRCNEASCRLPDSA